MVSPSAKRRAVRAVKEQGIGSASQACRALGLARSSYYATSRRSNESIRKENRIVELSKDKPRYGYRRITALMRREGEQANPKRVQAVRRKHGLQVRKKQRRTRRASSNDNKRLSAEYGGHVWSWDFVHDQTENGASLRILSILDEYTRQCPGLRPRRSYRARDVIHVLEELISEHGAPAYIRSDNGPEFIAYAIRDWLAAHGIRTHYITPGSPWEQAYVESFHDKLRDELLNREIFANLSEAETMLEDWRNEYNDERPHSSLDYLTPNEYARATAPAEANQISYGKVGGFVCSPGTSALLTGTNNKNQRLTGLKF